MPLPFEDSRRLIGANLFFASTGAVLEATGAGLADWVVDAWRARIHRATQYLRWPVPLLSVRRHASGVSLALSAPVDQLFLATEVNEWAFCASLAEREPQLIATLEAALRAQAVEAAPEGTPAQSIIAPVIDEAKALQRFDRLSRSEANPTLRAVWDAASVRGLPHAVDDTEVMLGAGAGARQFPTARLPSPAEVPWDVLHDIPTALVTGSNGKTTTVRLLAACARANGWHAGFNCTDGVFLDDEMLLSGDYSGPAGARTVLRHPRTQAAILETARGGILRRGIAVSQADVAVVTNVSSDHFGEYGIDDLAGLADVKLVVAAAVKADGLLVLNADDAQLRTAAANLAPRFGRVPPLGWFDVTEHSARLKEFRSHGASTSGIDAGRLVVSHGGATHDLGAITAMPLSMNGVATYNVANLAGAALAGIALRIPAATIAAVLATFGAKPTDNPGRMMRFDRHGVTLLIDYAHNPEGLRGFLAVATHLRGAGRLALLLGHAGNRLQQDIEALAQEAVDARPDFIVVKENDAQLRGREPGEVPRIIRTALLSKGFPESQIALRNSEVEAARCALDWARPGDVLALPVHSSNARSAVVQMIEERYKLGRE